MLATHNPKVFNAKLKQPGIAARIKADIPSQLVCSKTVNMQRELWAAPKNSADMRKWREVAQNLTDDNNFSEVLPDINDPLIKQLLVPFNWRNDEYISVTPVTSMGLMHELYQRLTSLELPYGKWCIQPNPAAISNHGEALLLQGGIVKMLRRGVIDVEQGDWKGSFVQLSAHCGNMNISSGMVAVGFPAITAIGGLVHAIERSINEDIDFAIGVKTSDWNYGVPKIIIHKNQGGSTTGRVNGKAVHVNPGFSTEEITATCEIVLLLKAASLQQIANFLISKNFRLAGSELFDIDVSIIENGQPQKVAYLVDASEDIINGSTENDSDSLFTALKYYSIDGEWKDDEWWQKDNRYTLNHSGYGFLEQPIKRPETRKNYPHAWAEPIFSLIKQESMSNKAWWSRKNLSSGIIWKGK